MTEDEQRVEDAKKSIMFHPGAFGLPLDFSAELMPPSAHVEAERTALDKELFRAILGDREPDNED
jgi:hypothetical protein